MRDDEGPNFNPRLVYPSRWRINMSGNAWTAILGCAALSWRCFKGLHCWTRNVEDQPSSIKELVFRVQKRLTNHIHRCTVGRHGKQGKWKCECISVMCAKKVSVNSREYLQLATCVQSSFHRILRLDRMFDANLWFFPGLYFCLGLAFLGRRFFCACIKMECVTNMCCSDEFV